MHGDELGGGYDAALACGALGTGFYGRQVSAIELPAGKPVELKPGGLHLMLMGLKAPLKAGETVSFTLVVEGTDGKRETLALKAPVKAASGMP